MALLAVALKNTQGETRRALLLALGSLEVDEATQSLREMLQSTEAEERREVIRALSSVRTYAGAGLLLEAATVATDQHERVLALRG